LLLQAVRSGYGCESVGVEPGLAYREASQKAGVKVYPRLEDLPREGEGRFDLVSLIHVLEHMPDPVGVLAHLRQDWLAPGGWLLVEVPDLYCHDCFEVAHLASFSSHTLAQVLRKAGYRLLAVRKHGQPRSRILPLYMTLLAQPLPKDETSAFAAVKPESSVRLKRRCGLARRQVLERLLPTLAWQPVK
jgi:SAM-dependent methyltransferase